MEIKDHKLQNDLRIQPYSQTECLSKPPEFANEKLPDAIIIHYTAMNKAEDAVNSLMHLKANGKNASAHLVIGKQGQIYQLAPFNYKTWHAGTSFYNGRAGYNNFSIGIEIANLGWLESYDDGKFFSRFDLMQGAHPVKRGPDEVVKKRHKNPHITKEYWDKYTPEQINAVQEICDLLSQRYHIKEILGHDEIAPDRKQDPGPDFPIELIRNEVLYSNREEEKDPDTFEPFTAKVDTAKLNIRSGPGVNDPKIANPLIFGKELTVLEKAGEWYKVKTEIEGWVNAKYVK